MAYKIFSKQQGHLYTISGTRLPISESKQIHFLFSIKKKTDVLLKTVQQHFVYFSLKLYNFFPTKKRKGHVPLCTLSQRTLHSNVYVLFSRSPDKCAPLLLARLARMFPDNSAPVCPNRYFNKDNYIAFQDLGLNFKWNFCTCITQKYESIQSSYRYSL